MSALSQRILIANVAPFCETTFKHATKENTDFWFLQEVNSTFKKPGLERWYNNTYSKSKDDVIIYSNNESLTPISIDSPLKDRFTCCLGVHAIYMSVHLPHNSIGTSRYSNLKTTVDIARNSSDLHGLPIIVAGDFNADVAYLEPLLKQTNSQYSIVKGLPRATKKTIDFAFSIVGPNCSVSVELISPKHFNLTGVVESNTITDESGTHYPFVVEAQFNPITVSTLADMNFAAINTSSFLEMPKVKEWKSSRTGLKCIETAKMLFNDTLGGVNELMNTLKRQKEIIEQIKTNGIAIVVKDLNDTYSEEFLQQYYETMKSLQFLKISARNNETKFKQNLSAIDDAKRVQLIPPTREKTIEKMVAELREKGVLSSQNRNSQLLPCLPPKPTKTHEVDEWKDWF